MSSARVERSERSKSWSCSARVMGVSKSRSKVGCILNRIVKVYENMIKDKVILMSISAGCQNKCPGA